MINRIQKKIKNLSSHPVGIILIYTFFWLVLVGLILFIFSKNEKTFLWMNTTGDGAYQHFASFEYLCDYLKDLIYNFHFSGFFNFSLGQGMDVLTTLNSYDFTDPVSIICALVFPLSRSSRYTLMIFIKLYLIGISFLFYCYVTERKKGMVIVFGAIAYVFSGAVLFMFARHPNYINWAYFFPFLLGGVELYFREKRKLPLILFVFFNLITSYYTFYMNVILVVIYVLVHVICRVVKEKSWAVFREEFIKCIKLIGVCSVGILLSAFILFPSIYAYLNNNRIGQLTGYTASAFLYESEYYKNIFENLFAPFKAEFNTSSVGLNVVLIIPLILIFTYRKRYTPMKVLLFISFIMLGIPLAGRILNGFGYATNRWAYAIPFYASVIFVLLFDEINVMSAKQKAYIFVVVTMYVTLCLLHTETNTDIKKYTTMIMIIAVVIVIGVALHYRHPAIEPLLFVLVFLGASFQIYFTFSEQEGDYVSQYLDQEQLDSIYTNVSSSALTNSSGDDFYRIEMEETQPNVNGHNKVYGTEFWWSMVSGDTMDFYTDLAIDSICYNCDAGGLDGRTELLELASVKYYTRPTQKNGLIPYGYKELHSENKSYQIFENIYALPIGYTYNSYIPYSKYETMNGLEREQALLQGAVLEENPDFNKTNIQSYYEVLDYDVKSIQGVTWEDNCIKPKDASSDKKVSRTISIETNIPENCEIYVYIDGVQLGDESETLNLTATRTIGEYSIKKSAKIHNLTFNWPSLQDDVAFNLGSGYDGTNIITISFDRDVSLSFDDIQIVAVPMSTYEKYAEQLGEYVLEDVDVSEDQINGKITVPEERILQFSVPYSDGWKAYVDGEEVSIMKSDVMYMAIPISAGSHDIELRYETPYLRIGLVVSIATAILFAAYEFINHTRKKHRGVREDG